MITYQQKSVDDLRRITTYDVCVDYVPVENFEFTEFELRANQEPQTLNILELKAYQIGKPFEEFFENYHLLVNASD